MLEDEKWTVDFPDDSELKSEIQFIVTKGLVKPKHFHEYLFEMYKQLGFRYLFRDATEIIFTLLLVSIAMMFSLAQVMESGKAANDLYAYLFTMAPILYMLIAALFLVNIRHSHTFAIEMTCKYHVYQLAAFRMLVFSIAAALLNIMYILLLFLFYQTFNLVEAMLISVSSLSIFSTGYLYIIQKVKLRVTTYAVMAGWLFVNAALAYFSKELYANVLSHIPFYVYISVIAGCLYLYVRRLNFFLTFRNVEGVI
ncbi:hypothetical protein LC048_19410 [Mesobacillus subterraneus]|uniref:hypothetical protein n=1 Tax=Mesobacillus subterraneus TaxID=285983 RepID=UPI001CFC6683|nr:hypothetical protein [Mesobacillus subterraneus]WLR54570.1 hypothetical protein LC048_19410 [Mesobacillus subterraneus]